MIDYLGDNIRLKCNGGCSKQPKLTCTHGKTVNIYIAYELDNSSFFNDDPTLKNSLFGWVRLIKNADIDKYQYSSYEIGFDWKSGFSFSGGGFGKHEIFFGVGMSPSVHVDNKKDILILGKGLPQGLEHTLTAGKMYSINFTVTRNNFFLSLHYNGANSYLFVNGTQII